VRCLGFKLQPLHITRDGQKNQKIEPNQKNQTITNNFETEMKTICFKTVWFGTVKFSLVLKVLKFYFVWFFFYGFSMVPIITIRFGSKCKRFGSVILNLSNSSI